MNIEGSGQAPRTLSMSPPSTCTHRRVISDCVSEEERKAGMVLCVECGGVTRSAPPTGNQGNVVSSPFTEEFGNSPLTCH